MTATTAKLTRWPMVAVFLSHHPALMEVAILLPPHLKHPCPSQNQAFWYKHPVLLYGSHRGAPSLLKVLATTRLQIAARGKERKDLLHYSFLNKIY